MKKTLQTIAAIAIFSTASLAQRTLLHCGTFIDVTKGNTQSQVTVIVEGKRVTGVQTGYLAPKGTDKVIDLKSKTVMPGLTDMHVHIEGETSKDQLVKRYQFNQADVAFEAARNAKTTLMAGFTSVRDLGGSGVNISLRNAISKGIAVITTQRRNHFHFNRIQSV